MTLLVGVPVFALVLSIVAANLGDGEAGDRRRSTRSLVYAGMACAMVLVFSILLPSIGKPREKANQIKCGSNLRQIGQGIQMYANDHKGQFPATFEQLISDQEFTTEVFICPSSNDDTASGATTRQTLIDFAKPGHCSYIYLGRGLTSAVSAQHVIAYEPLSNHQNLGINVMYGDGHVDWLNKAEAEYLVGQLGAGNNPPKKR